MKISLNIVLIWFLRLVIVSLFVLFITLGTKDFLRIWSFDSFQDFLSNLKYKDLQTALFARYRAALLLVIPLIGVFKKNSLGWVCLTTYFYFAFTSVIYGGLSEISEDVLFYFSTLIVTIIPILILNKKGIFGSFFGISHTRKFLFNIISLILGISITIFVVYSGG